MATLLRLDPLGGCFAAPTAMRVTAGARTAGNWRSLAADDAQTVSVASTTSPPRVSEWTGIFSGIPEGLQNPRLT